MTEVAYIKNLLEANWNTSVSGRSNDVPQPTFTLEKKDFKKQIRTADIGYVNTGADTEFTPLGFSWTHERIDTVVVIQYRAGTRKVDTGVEDGYKRLFGVRQGTDGLQAPDNWSGIVGETRRVVMNQRRGQSEWDLVGNDMRVADLSNLGGKNYWRADVFVPLRIHASSIDASP